MVDRERAVPSLSCKHDKARGAQPFCARCTHVSGVLRGLVLGGVSDKPLIIGEGDPRRRNTVSLKMGEKR
jgi:hypothetical protein